MWSRIQQSKSSIFLFVFLGIELLNLILWKQTAMGFILLIIFFVFIAISSGLGIGANALISQAMGEKNLKWIRRVFLVG